MTTTSLQLLVLILSVCSVNSEVSQDFNNCRKFFYKRIPPELPASDVKDICQFYKNGYRFATKYSTNYRIALYSAYTLPHACDTSGEGKQGAWFVEPQVSGYAGKAVAVAGENTQTYKNNQAVNDDYRNTDYDKGHLYPKSYACGNDARTGTFTLTNAVPQNPCFNTKLWKEVEAKTKTFMEHNCAYVCATRYFVTGVVPTEKRIPDRIHDKESDRVRPSGYNRVSIPSHMWTAACCDTTSCPDKETSKKGFSFAYIGKNQAVPYLRASSVKELENTLATRYKYIYDINFRQRIFTEDKCNIDPQKSDKIKVQLENIINIMMKNEVNLMNDHQLSTLPLKKRKLLSDAQREFAVDVKKYMTVSNIVYETDVNWQDRLDIETKLDVQGLTLMLTGITCLTTALKGKRDVNGDKCNHYSIVRKQSFDNAITVGGEHCKKGHSCAYNQAKSYKWCYTDDSSWDRCCVDECDFRGKDYMWCNDGESWQYCSPRYSKVTIDGNVCKKGHECGLHNKDYYWCYTDDSLNWGYCCQPWEPCRFHEGYSSKYCYHGKTKNTKWDYCKS